MNAIKSLIAVVATVAATGALAQEATPDTWIAQAKSVATRQAVSSEARAALAAGKIESGEVSGRDFTAGFQPMFTRGQVVAEAIEAQRLGLTQGGEVQRVATTRELESIRRAGARVVDTSVAAR